MTEHQIQSAAIKEIRKISGCEWAFSIPNARKCNAIQGNYLKSEGRLAGVWDVFVPCQNQYFCGLFIEFKTGKNKLTHEQCMFGISMQRSGYALAICRSANEAIDAVLKYKKNNGSSITHSASLEIKELIEKRKKLPTKSTAIDPPD